MSKQKVKKQSEAAAPGPVPQRADVGNLYRTALQHHRTGHLVEAEIAYRRILAIHAAHCDSLHFLGVIAYQTGRHKQAADLIQQAIQFDATNAIYRCNLGLALRALGRPADAEATYRAAVILRPDSVESYSNLGNLLKEQGRLEQSAISARRGVVLQPDRAETHLNLGLALGSQLRKAIPCYRHAIAIAPHYAEAYYNLGNALKEQGTLEAALDAYDKALSAKPDFAAAYSNLGNVFKDQGRLDEAIAAYRQATMLNPNLAESHSNRLMCLHYGQDTTNALLFQESGAFGRQFAAKQANSRFDVPPVPERRLKIGYVSGDFHSHPVGYFMTKVLASHDAAQVETFCYSNHGKVDDLTKVLRSTADHWRSIAGRSDDEVLALILRDGIDVLIDLSGHTARNRLLVFAQRAAPVQVSWLGYFGTTGLATMDYVLADRFVAPADEDRTFHEKVHRLPGSYLCFAPPDVDVDVGPLPALSGSVTFGCFNHRVKITAPTIALWSRVLRSMPGSQLVLKTAGLDQPDVRKDLLAQFAAQGVPDRSLILEGHAPRRELLADYRRVDIALDPMPFGGGTTTAEALWMGVPVITLPGSRWVGRVSLSILEAIGLRQCVAKSEDHYVAIASGLAKDLPALADLRQGLRSQVENSALCDGPKFTRDLEAAYRIFWQNYCAAIALK